MAVDTAGHTPEADWLSIFTAMRDAGVSHPKARHVARVVTCQPPPCRPASRIEIEEALSKLIDQVCPGLRSAEILCDAEVALAVLSERISAAQSAGH